MTSWHGFIQPVIDVTVSAKDGYTAHRNSFGVYGIIGYLVTQGALARPYIILKPLRGSPSKVLSAIRMRCDKLPREEGLRFFIRKKEGDKDVDFIQKNLRAVYPATSGGRDGPRDIGKNTQRQENG